MLRAVERATGKEFTAKAIEGGFEVYEDSTLYKKVRESTFKRYFRVAGQVEESKEEEEQEKVKPEPKAAKKVDKVKPEPKQEQAEEVEEVSAEKRQQIIDKIKKLLNLSSNNPSKEEAMSAALMAQKLMAKYKIQEDETLDEIKEEDLIDSVFADQKHNSSFHSWRRQLAVIVAKNFCCKCYMKGQDIVFRGFKQDAEIALNAYLYLYTIGDKLGSKEYNEQLRNTGSGKGVYNSFVMGFLQGVDEGLSVQCTALMLITPQAVEDEWKTFSANFRKGSARSISITDGEVYRKGKTEGKAAIQSRQLEGKRGRRN